MRRSDIWFLGVMVITLMMVVTELVLNAEFGINFLPELVYHFWWVLLLPYIIIKLFFRNSKLFKWLNTEIKIKNGL